MSLSGTGGGGAGPLRKMPRSDAAWRGGDAGHVTSTTTSAPIACETCHIPSFARTTPTLLRRDYSTAGRDLPEAKDKFGMPTYAKQFGTLTWGMDQVPDYLWSDGSRQVALIGDKIDPAG